MTVEHLPWLAAMGLLILCSGFFSSSEAALFLLNRQQRRELAGGSRPQRVAAHLLEDPDRLLTAVLFWNLLVNVTYFAMASIASLRLQSAGQREYAGFFALVSLLMIIVFAEMLPKSVAVLHPRGLAAWLAIPLAATVRVVDPVLPAIRWAKILSQRVFWPHFKQEPYLEVADLERAVHLSTADATLLQQEKTVLQNIVLLSTMRVDELMRPRTNFVSFRPPVSLADLEGQAPPSGYVLVTEADSEEIAGAFPVHEVTGVPKDNLDQYASQIVYVPWCTTVAHAMEQMRENDRRIAAVVNEFGETIGIITFEDILHTTFTLDASRSERLLKQQSIESVGKGQWRVTGMTTLRRLERRFNVQLPPGKSVTVAGLVQETLGRLPQPG
ncbi:MAG: CNNM domain-containing protein, partial [Planctomycetota bacterium]|nr:CNNM domain-containing protein [Planctomycetota bacterium]